MRHISELYMKRDVELLAWMCTPHECRRSAGTEWTKNSRKWDHPKMTTTCDFSLLPKHRVYRKTSPPLTKKWVCTEHSSNQRGSHSYPDQWDESTEDAVSIKHKHFGDRARRGSPPPTQACLSWNAFYLISKNKLCQHASSVGIKRWFIWVGLLECLCVCCVLGMCSSAGGHNYQVHSGV